jgi:thioredoxin reductase
MDDLIIVGGSAAGSSAAVYAARARMKFRVVALDLGGEVATSGEIGNWPGVNHTTGTELAQKFNEQLEFNGVKPDVGVEIRTITKQGDVFRLEGVRFGSDPVSYESRTVLLTTGVHPRHLDVPGEKEFYQKGVTYCTTCDGPLYKDKVVVTIGGGNSANESGIMLAGIAKKVYVLTIHDAMKGEAILIENLTSKPNVEIVTNATTLEILGNQKVTGVKYKDKAGKEQTLAVDGVFVHVGLIPNSAMVKDLVALNPLGYVPVDRLGATEMPGLYAAGDVIDHPYQQIAIAAGQGVTALLAIQSYLNSH